MTHVCNYREERRRTEKELKRLEDLYNKEMQLQEEAMGRLKAMGVCACARCAALSRSMDNYTLPQGANCSIFYVHPDLECTASQAKPRKGIAATGAQLSAN